ncbi:MAG: sterol desaturase family protein [Betaproteobacteria bacterium]|nr:MAG: sterol desaturase family protein [Betaproteobacteria bacterium]
MDAIIQSLGQQLLGAHYYLLAASLGVSFFIEGLSPAIAEPSERARWLHVARNLGLWLIGFVLVETLIFNVMFAELSRAAIEQWGVARLPAWVAVIVGVLVLDFFDYVFHRTSHTLRALWSLHLVHHADLRLDGSTSLRAHPLELLLGAMFVSLVLFLFGIPIWVFAFRAVIQLPTGIWHHTNWRMPAKLEERLETIMVTPAMHRLHHSPVEVETNSNFSQTFSIWDRMFGTYRDPRAATATKDDFGLERLRDPRWHSVAAMLKLPLSTRRFDRF